MSVAAVWVARLALAFLAVWALSEWNKGERRHAWWLFAWFALITLTYAIARTDVTVNVNNQLVNDTGHELELCEANE